MTVAFSVEELALQFSAALDLLAPKLQPAQADAFFTSLGISFPNSLAANTHVSGELGTSSTRSSQAAQAGRDLRAQLGSLSTADLAIQVLALTTKNLDAFSQFSTLRDALIAEATNLGLTQARVSEFAATLPGKLLEFAVVTRLQTNARPSLSVLGAAGVVSTSYDVTTPPEDSRPAFVRRSLDLTLLSGLLGNPASLLTNLGVTSASLGNLSLPPETNGKAFLGHLASALQMLTGHGALTFEGDFWALTSFLAKVSVDRQPGAVALRSRLNVEVPAGLDFGLDLSDTWHARLTSTGRWPLGQILKLPIDSPGSIVADALGGQLPNAAFRAEFSATQPGGVPIGLVGAVNGSRIEIGSLVVAVNASVAPSGAQSTGSVNLEFGLNSGKFVVDLASGDGFLKSLLGGQRVEADFEASAKFSLDKGLVFEAGTALAIKIPLHATFGSVKLDGLTLSFPLGSGTDLPIDFATALQTSIGPFSLAVDRVGLGLGLTFPSQGGNLGLAQIDATFLPPTGIGLSLDGPGGVTGGGFLSFDKDLGRYSGSVELQVFGVGVKAFGVVDTKFPDGRDGFSFVIVIAAEFTPVQVGFGFTLNGVGGLLALNRSLITDALSTAIRNGSVEHLLFPHDPVRDAPSILNDLETIFPATVDHQVVGPMAKLGWGTPTLITAELGIVIELPGPRIAVIGTAQTALPTREISLVKLNLAIGGVLDFPKKLFSLDASLYDSRVGSFTVSGDAAFRMSFGDRANFVFSIGGFNPSFKAPPNFPKLRRASVDLGVNGNPSLTLSGYFALTSNTAQIGAAIRLYASGAGIELEGHVAFDALFVFSPFSFEADLDAGMSVSFHGVGFGIHFHGHLSGPSPYRVAGDVCVSILWWDACLSVEATFGESQKAELPTIDPWIPQGVDDSLGIIGLRDAVADARNWFGSPPPSVVSVVSLAESSAEKPPIDPLGAATLRQKVVPLNQKLTRFGAFKPKTNDFFKPSQITIGATGVDDEFVTPVTDDFARDTFKSMNSAERLSAPPYDEMQAGFTLKPDVIHVGDAKPKSIEFETVLLDGNRAEVAGDPFSLTARHLRAMLQKSAAGLGGVRRTGLAKYINPTKGVKFRLPRERFSVADACGFAVNSGVTPAPTTHIQASLALEAHLFDHPEDAGRFTVVPGYELGI